MMWHATREWWLETKSYARILRASSATCDRGSKNQNFPFLNFRFSAGVWGELTKNGKEIFGFASPFQSPKRALLFYNFWLLFSPPSRRDEALPLRI